MDSPVRSLISAVSGANFHAKPGATLASKRTVKVRSPRAKGAAGAARGVPANPVAAQKSR
jgi:hypothetical protein